MTETVIYDVNSIFTTTADTTANTIPNTTAPNVTFISDPILGKIFWAGTGFVQGYTKDAPIPDNPNPFEFYYWEDPLLESPENCFSKYRDVLPKKENWVGFGFGILEDKHFCLHYYEQSANIQITDIDDLDMRPDLIYKRNATNGEQGEMNGAPIMALPIFIDDKGPYLNIDPAYIQGDSKKPLIAYPDIIIPELIGEGACATDLTHVKLGREFPFLIYLQCALSNNGSRPLSFTLDNDSSYWFFDNENNTKIFYDYVSTEVDFTEIVDHGAFMSTSSILELTLDPIKKPICFSNLATGSPTTGAPTTGSPTAAADDETAIVIYVAIAGSVLLLAYVIYYFFCRGNRSTSHNYISPRDREV